MKPIRTIILGAAGRDFHNFNVAYREDPATEVVAFTATQIPDIEDRTYPPELAGPRYPRGIPIVAEAQMESLIERESITRVVFAYSDVSHETVMHLASRALACGADFVLLGPNSTELVSPVPVIAVCAVRTGSGKSQTTRRILDIVRARGLRTVVVRHPMPYAEDLNRQRVQRFATFEDLDANQCTVEEREEYEPHLLRGAIVYAGIDYGEILAKAGAEADVILWDGGNNDLPFYRPDLHIVVADPLRAGHEIRYHPGEANLRSADVVVINKVDTASADMVHVVRTNVFAVNPDAVLIEAASPIVAERPELLRGRRVIVIEDGPTLTHGEMNIGAGFLAARRAGAREIIDPRPIAVGTLAATFAKYPNTGAVLPAMGYSEEELADLEKTIARSEAEAVVVATPVDLADLITIKAPVVRVAYELQEIGQPTLDDVIGGFLASRVTPSKGRA